MKKPPLLYASEQVQMRRCADAQLCRFADDRATKRPQRTTVRFVSSTSTNTIIYRIIQSNNYCNDYEYDHKTNDKSKYLHFREDTSIFKDYQYTALYVVHTRFLFGYDYSEYITKC